MKGSNNLVSKDTLEFKESFLNITQSMKEFVDNIDDEEIKNDLGKILKSLTETYNFVVIGQVNSGKSSFINALIGKNICQVSAIPCTDKIHEIKYGEIDTSISISDKYTRQFLKNESIRDISIIDTPGIGSIYSIHDELTNEFLSTSDLILVVLSPQNVYSNEIWDKMNELKKHYQKEVIFIIQQVDTISEDNTIEIEKYVQDKVQSIYQENRKIFKISAMNEIERVHSGIDNFKNYIKSNITSKDLILKKQISNIHTYRNYLNLINKSFDLRYNQYLEDLAIVKKIDKSLDEFHEIHKTRVNKIIEDLSSTIDKLVEEFRNDIIGNVQADTIKEKFENPSNFELWLSTKIDYYKDKLTKLVSLNTQNAIKSYLYDLDDLIQDTSKLLTDRKQHLDFENRIYGELAEQKNAIVLESNCTLRKISEYNCSLFEAAGDFFYEIWEEREKYEKNRRIFSGAGTIVLAGVGARVGTTIGVAAAPAIATFISSLVKVAIGTAIGPPVGLLCGAVIGGTIGYKLTKRVSAKIFEGNMYQKTLEAIATFNINVDNSKIEMIANTEELVREFFQNELKQIEKYFLGFRSITYFDETKLIEDKKVLESIINDTLILEGIIEMHGGEI